MSNQTNLLMDKFNTLLKQYRETYQEYLKSINSKELSLQYGNQLKQLNDELIDVNNKITKDLTNYKNKNEENSEILNNNYNILQDERIQIENIINQYETINSAYEDGKITVNTNYYSYILYLFIAVFLVILLFKTTLSNSQIGGGEHHLKLTPLLFIFLCFVIIFNSYIKNNY